VTKKAYFHQLNHIIPYIKLTTVQAAQIECGSDVSNWIGKNKAAEAKKPFGPEFGYPFSSDKCYSTVGGGALRSDPLVDKNGNISWTPADRMISSG